MPLSKLQQALKAQQSKAAFDAYKKKSGQHKKEKEESLKHTPKEKKSMKRARQAVRPVQEEGVDSNGQKIGQDGMVVIDSSMIPAEEEKERPMRLSRKQQKKANANPNQAPIVPFDKFDTILLLGEANFSYALSLLAEPHLMPAHQMLATSYDTEKECYLKYPDGEDNIKALREKGVKVEFRVDAGNLEKCKAVGKGRWSKVIFNFPHAGAGITDQDRNILTNQHLLLRTLRSVNPVLTTGSNDAPTQEKGNKSIKAGKTLRGKANNKKRKRPAEDEDREIENDDASESEDENMFDINDDPILEDDESDDDDKDNLKPKKFAPTLTPPDRAGSILITLLNQAPYTLWSLPQLAQRPPTHCPGTRLQQPRYQLLRSFKFHPDLYPGYAHRRTIGWKEGKSKSENEEILGRQGEARTWEFIKFIPKEERN